jgi:hypothetical protein
MEFLRPEGALIGEIQSRPPLFAGNHTAWPVIVLIVLVSAITALWQLF